MDGRTDRRMDGWMDGWRLTNIASSTSTAQLVWNSNTSIARHFLLGMRRMHMAFITIIWFLTLHNGLNGVQCICESASRRDNFCEVRPNARRANSHAGKYNEMHTPPLQRMLHTRQTTSNHGSVNSSIDQPRKCPELGRKEDFLCLAAPKPQPPHFAWCEIGAVFTPTNLNAHSGTATKKSGTSCI